jgi:tripartite ATP-independent transporter DctM subunit
MEETALIAIVGCVMVVVLMLMRVWISVSLGLVSLVGFAYMVGIEPAIGLLIDSPIRTVTNFEFSVIPMFILMGGLVGAGGMSRELFRAANAWLGHLPGGMAMASIFACGGFAAINGSSIATAATMTQVALPEMRRAGYDPGMSLGIIAAGGTLGIMIPPSVLFVIFSVLTEVDLAQLFISGVVPGLVAIVLYCIAIQCVCAFFPHLLPRGGRADWKERFDSLRDVWATLLLFFIVVGSIYGGFTTVTEAASIGVIGALGIGLARKRLTRKMILECLIEALRTSAAIFFIAISAFLFQFFLAVTEASQSLATWMVSLDVEPITIMIFIVIAYLLAGTFIDELATVLLTVPILFPVVVHLGFDPLYFAVLVVMTTTIGLYAPPVGIICFILRSIARDISLMQIYKGTLPMLAADIIRLILLVAFPALSLWLPSTMR